MEPNKYGRYEPIKKILRLQNQYFNVAIDCAESYPSEPLNDLYQAKLALMQNVGVESKQAKEKLRDKPNFDGFLVHSDTATLLSGKLNTIEFVNWSGREFDFLNITVRWGVPNSDELDKTFKTWSKQRLNIPLFDVILDVINEENEVKASQESINCVQFDWDTSDRSEKFGVILNNRFMTMEAPFSSFNNYMMIEIKDKKETVGSFAFKILVMNSQSFNDRRKQKHQKFTEKLAMYRSFSLSKSEYNRETHYLRKRFSSYRGMFASYWTDLKDYSTNSFPMFFVQTEQIFYLNIKVANFSPHFFGNEISIEITSENIEDIDYFELLEDQTQFPSSMIKFQKKKNQFCLTFEMDDHLDLNADLAVLAFRFHGKEMKNENSVIRVNLCFFDEKLKDRFNSIDFHASLFLLKKTFSKTAEKETILRKKFKEIEKTVPECLKNEIQLRLPNSNLCNPLLVARAVIFIRIEPADLFGFVPVFLYSLTTKEFIQAIVATHNRLFDQDVVVERAFLTFNELTEPNQKFKRFSMYDQQFFHYKIHQVDAEEPEIDESEISIPSSKSLSLHQVPEEYSLKSSFSTCSIVRFTGDGSNIGMIYPPCSTII